MSPSTPPQSRPLRIASWNINSIRARPHLIEQLLDTHAVDILCLQETKCEDNSFPRAAMEAHGFTHIHLAGQRMHHGVAICSRVPVELVSRHDWQANGEARHISVRLPGGAVLHNVYVPAGGDVPDRAANPKFGQKLDFLARMTDWSGALTEPSIVLGDFNIAPHPEDVWDHKALLGVVSHTPVEVDTLAALQASHGWVDLGRRFVPRPERLYTWWSYRAKDWAVSDRGRRLDHMWATPEVATAAVAHRVHEDCRSWERPSDHIPIVTDFAF